MGNFISGTELDGLAAYLNETIRGDELTLQPAVWLSLVRWSQTLSTPPLCGIPIGSEGFARSIGGRIPPDLLNRIANDAGMTYEKAKGGGLSLWDLISTAASRRKNGGDQMGGRHQKTSRKNNRTSRWKKPKYRRKKSTRFCGGSTIGVSGVGDSGVTEQQLKKYHHGAGQKSVVPDGGRLQLA